MSERLPLKSSGIFYDSANLSDFRKWFDTGILGGATTNPVILQKEGVLDIPRHISKMVKIAGKGFPISIEVPDSRMSPEEMILLAKKYHHKFPENAVIKIPMDPVNPQKSFEVIYKLAKEGVRLNATLGLSAGQLIGASEALRNSKAKGDNYISLFWARRNEAKEIEINNLVKKGEKKIEAENIVPDAAECLATTLKYLETHYLSVRIIIGSIRNIDQIEKAFSLGADIVTIPPRLIEKWMFTQRGVETLKEFDQAYRSLKNNIKLF